jgi:hypothetical protein
MSKFSGAFRGLWRKRIINIAEYEYCENELIRMHESKVTRTFILTRGPTLLSTRFLKIDFKYSLANTYE